MSWSALSSGDAVEVSDDRGESTWQSASIIHPFISSHMYLVAFDTAIKATVSSARVRPRPESEHFTSNFELSQLVDVKIGGVWRPGVVCKVHVAEGKKFYVVNMGGTEREIEHGGAEIRASVDWINGQWALATDKGKPIKLHILGNSNSNSEALHKNKTFHECKVTNAINPMRNLIDEVSCEKSIATPMPNIENKGIPTFEPCKITRAPDSVSLLHDCVVNAIGCSDNLKFQSCKRARKEETIEDDSRILNIKKPKHSECLESLSLKKLEFDICMPTSKEYSNFNIKSMVDKLHYYCLFNTKESNINNMTQESGRLCNKEEHSEEISLHNEPLQTTKLWSEGVSSHIELGKKFSESEGLLNKVAYQHTSRERRRKNNKPQKLVIVEPSLEGSNVPNIKKSSLPFKKCSVLWETLKLMEIFTVMPQNPHFSPLVKHCSEYSEGMDHEGIAIGLMVTFSNLVANIPNINISDPPEKFDDIAKALLNLQWHGFSVEKVQSRLFELIKLKEKHERLANKNSKLKMVLVELTKKIESNDENLSEIEKNLSHLYELRSRGLSEEKERDFELDKLMMELNKIDDDILDARLGFEADLSFFP